MPGRGWKIEFCGPERDPDHTPTLNVENRHDHFTARIQWRKTTKESRGLLYVHLGSPVYCKPSHH